MFGVGVGVGRDEVFVCGVCIGSVIIMLLLILLVDSFSCMLLCVLLGKEIEIFRVCMMRFLLVG